MLSKKIEKKARSNGYLDQGANNNDISVITNNREKFYKSSSVLNYDMDEIGDDNND